MSSNKLLLNNTNWFVKQSNTIIQLEKVFTKETGMGSYKNLRIAIVSFLKSLPPASKDCSYFVVKKV